MSEVRTQAERDALAAAAKNIREFRMSDGDSFGTLLYATEYCAGPSAEEALQQMHALSSNIASAAVFSYLASLAARGMRVMSREATEAMLYEMGQAANFHLPRDANRAIVWRAMFDSFADLNSAAPQTMIGQEKTPAHDKDRG